MVGDGTSSENRIKWPSLYSAVVLSFEWRALDPTSGQSNGPPHVAFHVYKRGGHLTHGPPVHLKFSKSSLLLALKNPPFSSFRLPPSAFQKLRCKDSFEALETNTPTKLPPRQHLHPLPSQTLCKSPDCACFEIIFHCSLGKYLL